MDSATGTFCKNSGRKVTFFYRNGKCLISPQELVEPERQQQETARQQTEQKRQQRELAEQEVAALTAKLRELGVDPDRVD